jgi:hypothetical protein
VGLGGAVAGVRLAGVEIDLREDRHRQQHENQRLDQYLLALEAEEQGCAEQSFGAIVVNGVEHRVVHPGVHLGLSPARAALRQLDLLWKLPSLNLPVECGAAEASLLEHGPDPENSVLGL